MEPTTPKPLETLGPRLGLPSFFMIQWVAPLASESPGFAATAYLVRKLRTTSTFNALISSKLDQWTPLIGTLVVVYGFSLGSYGVLRSSRRLGLLGGRATRKPECQCARGQCAGLDEPAS